ncbi:MAG: hypothetical protein WDM96_11380 [Lacunisphaera sp.]
MNQPANGFTEQRNARATSARARVHRRSEAEKRSFLTLPWLCAPAPWPNENSREENCHASQAYLHAVPYCHRTLLNSTLFKFCLPGFALTDRNITNGEFAGAQVEAKEIPLPVRPMIKKTREFALLQPFVNSSP